MDIGAEFHQSSNHVNVARLHSPVERRSTEKVLTIQQQRSARDNIFGFFNTVVHCSPFLRSESVEDRFSTWIGPQLETELGNQFAEVVDRSEFHSPLQRSLALDKTIQIDVFVQSLPARAQKRSNERARTRRGKKQERTTTNITNQSLEKRF
jgi:hypothetical protein